MRYARPLARLGPPQPDGAFRLAGGWCWFDEVEILSREAPSRVISARELPDDLLAWLTAPRAPVAGVAMDRPRLMGIVNATPDSFSDGGRYDRPEAGIAQGQRLAADGADFLDVGGESTRPGAAEVPAEIEAARVVPVIGGLAGAAPVSVDTRKASVAGPALEAGAVMVNDVAGLSFDPALAPLVAKAEVPVCIMHHQGLPKTMQDRPSYGDVLLEVYDWLESAINRAEAAGIARSRIVVDPGIGFGKTTAHNLALLRGIALFHGLGCPVLLGLSRKRFLGELGGVDEPEARDPATLALTQDAVAQGIHIHRVHNVALVAQGLRLWQALHIRT